MNIIETKCHRCGKQIWVWDKEPDLCGACRDFCQVWTPLKYCKPAKKRFKACGYWEGLWKWSQ